MPSVPTWLTGKHVSSCSITPQSVASDGTLSDGTLASLTGTLDEITLESSPELEEISPMDTTRNNNVLIKDSFRVTLVQILKSGSANILAAAVTGSSVFKIIITRGIHTWTFYGQRSAYTESIRRGRSTASATFEMVDPGQANPAYTAV